MIDPTDVLCPFCSTFLVKGYDNDSRIKIRSSVLILEKSGRVIAVCRKCKNEVSLPITMSLQNIPKLYVLKK